MTKLEKKRRSRYFQQIIAKAMQQKSNTNVKGDMSFAEMKDQRDETLNQLNDILVPVCGEKQTAQILNTIRLGLRGETVVDCLPLTALGETCALIRGEARKAIKNVRSYDTIESVVELEQVRAYQHCNTMITVYWMVQKAYYTLYKRFMNEFSRTWPTY